MNRFIVIEGTSLYELRNRVNDFLKDNPDIQIISHSIEIREYKVTNDDYICTIIYKR